jgi:hypothetical protein
MFEHFPFPANKLLLGGVIVGTVFIGLAIITIIVLIILDQYPEFSTNEYIAYGVSILVSVIVGISLMIASFIVYRKYKIPVPKKMKRDFTKGIFVYLHGSCQPAYITYEDITVNITDPYNKTTVNAPRYFNIPKRVKIISPRYPRCVNHPEYPIKYFSTEHAQNPYNLYQAIKNAGVLGDYSVHDGALGHRFTNYYVDSRPLPREAEIKLGVFSIPDFEKISLRTTKTAFINIVEDIMDRYSGEITIVVISCMPDCHNSGIPLEKFVQAGV